MTIENWKWNTIKHSSKSFFNTENTFQDKRITETDYAHDSVHTITNEIVHIHHPFTAHAVSQDGIKTLHTTRNLATLMHAEIIALTGVAKRNSRLRRFASVKEIFREQTMYPFPVK